MAEAESWDAWRATIGIEDRISMQATIRRAYLDSCPSYEDLLQVVTAIDEEFVHSLATSATDYFAQGARFGNKIRNKRAQLVDRSGAPNVDDNSRPPTLPPSFPSAGKKKLDDELEVGEIFDLDAHFGKKGKGSGKKDKLDEEDEYDIDLAEGISKSAKQPSSASKDDYDYFEVLQQSQQAKANEDENLELATALSASMQVSGKKSSGRRTRTDFASRRSGAARKAPAMQAMKRTAFNRWHQKQPTPVVPPQNYISQQKQRQAFSAWAQSAQDDESNTPAPVSSSFAQARANSRLNRRMNRGGAGAGAGAGRSFDAQFSL